MSARARLRLFLEVPLEAHVSLPLLLALGCATDGVTLPAYDPGPVPVCEWSAVPLGIDEDPGVGFTAADVLAVSTGPRSATLKWDWTGETTVIDSELTGAGDPSWMTAEVVDSETGEPWVPEAGDTGSVETLCPAYIALPVAWTASTRDGRLDLSVTDQVALDAATVARVDVDLPLTALGGTGIPMEIDPAEWDEVSFQVVANTSEAVDGAGGTVGEIAVYADRTGETDDVAYDEGYGNDVARWPWEK